jgi:hypothetical protein
VSESPAPRERSEAEEDAVSETRVDARCRCQDDKGNVNFDPACPFHGDNGTMIAHWPNRKDPYA